MFIPMVRQARGFLAERLDSFFANQIKSRTQQLGWIARNAILASRKNPKVEPSCSKAALQ
jgi:hypothetical protein